MESKEEIAKALKELMRYEPALDYDYGSGDYGSEPYATMEVAKHGRYLAYDSVIAMIERLYAK